MEIIEDYLLNRMNGKNDLNGIVAELFQKKSKRNSEDFESQQTSRKSSYIRKESTSHIEDSREE